MVYNDALAQLEALGNQTFKKKKKKQEQPKPISPTPHQMNLLKGVGVPLPAPPKPSTFDRIIDKPRPTSTSDVRVLNVGKPNLSTPVRVQPTQTRTVSTRLQDNLVSPTVTRPIYDLDTDLRTQGLPTADELVKAGIEPNFAAKHPTFAKAMLKVSAPIEKFEQTTTPGKFLKRTSQTAAELMTGQPMGTYGETSTGNRVLDIISDLVGTAGGFVAPTGIASQAMAPSRAVMDIPQVAGAVAKAGKFAKPAERAVSGVVGGATFGGLTGLAEEGDIGDVAKSATEDALIFGALEVGLPYIGEALKKVTRPVGVRLRGAIAGKKIQPLDDFTIVSAKEPERLIAEGWEEFRPGSGVWVKRDPKTNGVIDQYNETIVTLKDGKPEVTLKVKQWRDSQKGTTPRETPIRQVVEDVRDITPEPTGLAIGGKVKVPAKVVSADKFKSVGKLDGKALYNEGKIYYPSDLEEIAASVKSGYDAQLDGITDAGHDALYLAKAIESGDENAITSAFDTPGVHITKKGNSFVLRYDPDGYLKKSMGISEAQVFDEMFNAVKALYNDGYKGKLSIPEIKFNGAIEEFIGVSTKKTSPIGDIGKPAQLPKTVATSPIGNIGKPTVTTPPERIAISPYVGDLGRPAKADPVKQPWEMTREEYALTDGQGEHEFIVRKAINEGEPVPERVLNEYDGKWVNESFDKRAVAEKDAEVLAVTEKELNNITPDIANNIPDMDDITAWRKTTDKDGRRVLFSSGVVDVEEEGDLWRLYDIVKGNKNLTFTEKRQGDKLLTEAVFDGDNVTVQINDTINEEGLKLTRDVSITEKNTINRPVEKKVTQKSPEEELWDINATIKDTQDAIDFYTNNTKIPKLDAMDGIKARRKQLTELYARKNEIEAKHPELKAEPANIEPPNKVEPAEVAKAETKIPAEFTAEERKRIKEAGQRAYNGIAKQQPHKTPSGGYITKKEIQEQARKVQKEIEESEKAKIRQEKVDEEIYLAGARDEKKAIKQAEADRRVRLDNRKQFIQQAKDEGFNFYTAQSFAYNDVPLVKSDINRGKVTQDEVNRLIDYAEGSGLFNENDIKWFKEWYGYSSPELANIKPPNKTEPAEAPVETPAKYQPTEAEQAEAPVKPLDGGGVPKKETPTEAYTKASSFIDRIRKGEPATLDEVKAEVEHIFSNEDAITAQLQGMTNKELDKLLPWTQRGRYKKKDELVEAVADNLLTQAYYEVSGSNSLTIQSWGSRGEWKKEVKQKVQNALDKHTPETWEKALADSKKEYEEALAKRKERLEGVKTPKTLDDFRTARQLRKLTPEEQDTYEDLLARDKKSSRLQKKQMDAERKADKASAVLEGDKFTITKDKHTKTGEDVWVVKLNERVEAEEWKSINASMKSLGGNWWRGNQGWNFKTDPTEKLDVAKKIETKAEAKQESNVTKLRKVADNMQDDIDDALRPRLANTARRARMAANTIEYGEAQQRLQQTLRNIADAIEKGEAELLTEVDSRAQIETLNRTLSLAQMHRLEEKKLSYDEYSKERAKPYTIEDIRHAQLPIDELHVSHLTNIAGEIENKDGYKLIASRLKKAVKNAKGEYVPITGRLREDLEKIVKDKTLNLQRKDIIEDNMANRKRLERMGIESAEELRAYLREYLNYRVMEKYDPKQKAIQEKELEVIGRKIQGFFPTPKPVVDKMLDAADITDGMDILEPSAGKGNIADAIGKPDVIEIVPTLREILDAKGHNLVASDFLEYKGKQYDRIIMNPPFEKGQDIDHVRHAYELLKPGGRIVAIMSEGPFFRGDKKATAFREWLDEIGTSEKLPEGSFKTAERSTGVNTRIVVIDKPKKDVLEGIGTGKKELTTNTDNVKGNAKVPKEIPFLGIVGKNGYKESYGYTKAEESDFHHSYALSPEGADVYNSDDTLRFVRYGNEKAYTLEGNPSLDPFGKGFKQIQQFADHVIENGASKDIPVKVAQQHLGTEFEGKTIGTVGDFATKAKPVTKTQPLDNIGTDIDRTLASRVDANTPDMGTTLGFANITPNVPKSKKGHTFLDSEVEERFRNAHGVPKRKATEKLTEFLDTFKRKATREYEHLPRGAKYAQLRYELTKLKKQKGVASDITLRNQQGITAGIDGGRYDVFERKVILDDLLEEAIAGNQLPFGFTEETVKKELSRLPLDDGIKEAVELRSALWEKIVSDYTKAMKSIGFNVDDRFKKKNYYRHQILEYANAKGLTGQGKKLRTPTGRGFLKKREGSNYDINTNYLEAEYEVMAQMLYDTEVAKTIKAIDTEYNIIAKLKSEAETSDKAWEELIPEGYTIWQPREGNVFFMAESIPERLVREVVDKGIAELTAKDIKQVLAVGSKYKEFVIPEEVALTLDDMLKDRPKGFLNSASSQIMTKWKQWQLVSPRRIVKYNLRNITGDADAVFVGNPSGFKKIPQAIGDLYPVFFGDKSMTPEMKEWFKRGGMQTLLQTQELGDINQLKMFVKKVQAEGKLHEIPVKVWQKYWKTARLSTDFREAILRYANYLDYLEQMGKNGTPKNFGASIPEEVMALKNIRDRAFKLSNDLLGAYDEVSVLGQELREHLIPFWSWKEVNFRRYSRFIKNAVNMKDREALIRMGKKMGAKSPLIAFRVGKFMVQATAFSAMLEVWNRLVFPDLVDNVPDHVKGRPHIILGIDADGKIQYFSNLGAFGDFLEWFGLDSAPQMTRDYLSGKKSIKEIATEMAKKPVNIFAQGIRPDVKGLVELVGGQSLYPDVFDPSPIRDRWYQAFKNFGLENEYAAVTGKPMRGGYKDTIDDIIIYKADPGETAYNNARGKKYDYMEKIGKGSGGGQYTPKSNALYYLKMAIRYGDEEAMRKYLIEYLTYGGNAKGFKQSVKMMHPLSGLSKEEQVKYIKTLSKSELEELKEGIKWYQEVFAGKGK